MYTRVTVALDDDVLNEVDDWVEVSYYRSRTQFIEEAVIAFLEKLEAQEVEDQKDAD